MPLHPQAKAELEFLSSLGIPENSTQTPEQARLSHVGRRPPTPPPAEPVFRVQDCSIPGPATDLPIRIYAPGDDGPYPVTLGIHGGGWVLGDIVTEDLSCRGLANRANCIVVSVEYRRAPEAPFPEPLNDCYAALEWIAENAASFGGDPSRLAVAGTSAGGNLSAAVALKARDEFGPKLAHQALFVPVIDRNFETNSYREFGDDYFLTRDSMMYFWNHYAGDGADGEHPYASPNSRRKPGRITVGNDHHSWLRSFTRRGSRLCGRPEGRGR